MTLKVLKGFPSPSLLDIRLEVCCSRYMYQHPDRFHRRVRRGIPPEFRLGGPDRFNDFGIPQTQKIPSLKLTFLYLKMDGFNTSFLLGWPIFRGYLSFRECV